MKLDRILPAILALCRELAQPRPAQPRHWTSKQILLEASGCILASQVPHPMAVAAVDRLVRERLIPVVASGPAAEAITAALRGPLSVAYARGYRFPAQAGRRLARLAEAADDVVRAVLAAADAEPKSSRRKLVGVGCGLGPKQASLLLRNVHDSVELAVLDVHILAFMRLAGLTDAQVLPNGLASYESLEDRLQAYACGLQIPLQRLDVATWIVMRTARQMEVGCPS